jgi:hypothetical protein
MNKYLGIRFWVLLGLFIAVTISFYPKLNIYSNAAAVLTLSDSVSLSQASIERIMPDTGLSLSNEMRLTKFMDDAKLQESSFDWAKLNNQWLEYARAWFERVYPHENRFNEYVQRWVEKRNQLVAVRIEMREAYFSDLDDRELLMKAEWLKNQDEWKEMNEKISKQTDAIERTYNDSLEKILLDHKNDFLKLHELFVNDFLEEKSTPQHFFL